MTWYDITWYDVRWHDITWYDVRWHDMTWHDMIWHDMTWHDMTWYDMTWHDMTGETLGAGNQRRKLSWPGHDDMTWHDMTWHDMTWHNMMTELKKAHCGLKSTGLKPLTCQQGRHRLSEQASDHASAMGQLRGTSSDGIVWANERTVTRIERTITVRGKPTHRF